MIYIFFFLALGSGLLSKAVAFYARAYYSMRLINLSDFLTCFSFFSWLVVLCCWVLP